MIRYITKNDTDQIKNVLDNCDLFPSEYLDEMIAPFLLDSPNGHFWFTYERDGSLVALAFCAPMDLTEGTYNLYAIGIHNDYQQQGIGTELLNHCEKILKTKNQRLLIVETSSSESQLGARNFYKKCGYTHEATIRDFWNDGDDKIIFWKKLIMD